MTRLIVLDRDGVINRDSDAYIRSVAEFVPIDGSIEAVARLCRAGFKVAVCTNQSALARGLLSREVLADIHERLFALVRAAGGQIHALRHCPHGPEDACDCRKPRPGMLLSLMAELHASPEDTVFVGDSLRDIQAGVAAGCRAVLVRTGNGAQHEAAARNAGATDVYNDLGTFTTALLTGQAGAPP